MTRTSYWDYIESAYDSVSIYQGPKKFDKQFLSWPAPIQHLLAVHWCDSEVCNGGFEQFFFNDTGVLAPYSAIGYKAIGRPDLACLLQEAMSVFGVNYPRRRRARMSRLKALCVDQHTFTKLETDYYSLMKKTENRGDLYSVMDQYTRAHTQNELASGGP